VENFIRRTPLPCLPLPRTFPPKHPRQETVREETTLQNPTPLHGKKTPRAKGLLIRNTTPKPRNLPPPFVLPLPPERRQRQSPRRHCRETRRGTSARVRHEGRGHGAGEDYCPRTRGGGGGRRAGDGATACG